MKHAIKSTLAAAIALGTLGACAQFSGEDETPKYGSLKQTLMLVDAQGTRYGTVEMDPVSGGKLYDAEGRIIGTVVTPAVTSTVTTVTPVAPAY